jgi:hypothetical protein
MTREKISGRRQRLGAPDYHIHLPVLLYGRNAETLPAPSPADRRLSFSEGAQGPRKFPARGTRELHTSAPSGATFGYPRVETLGGRPDRSNERVRPSTEQVRASTEQVRVLHRTGTRLHPTGTAFLPLGAALVPNGYDPVPSRYAPLPKGYGPPPTRCDSRPQRIRGRTCSERASSLSGEVSPFSVRAFPRESGRPPRLGAALAPPISGVALYRAGSPLFA